MEPKRANLVTLGPVPEEKKEQIDKKTYRFDFTLSESTDKTCPEFSFYDLVKNAKGDEEDPFAKKDRQEADELAAIARAFEEKYADTQPKKRRVERLEDIVDLGDGYDLDDPFIDNTEAYDEIVPINMTTKHGGFYINSGALDFKFCSGNDDELQVMQMKKNKKKRVLESDEEGEENGGEKKKKKKKLLQDGEVVKKKKKLLTADDASMIKKKKKLVSSENIKLAKLKKGIAPSKLKTPGSNASSDWLNISGVQTPTGTENQAASVKSESNASEIKPNASLVTSENESESKCAIAATDTVLGSQKTVTVSCDIQDDSSSKPEVATNSKPRPEIPSLPDTLSLLALSNIDKIKDSVKEAEDSKLKFTPELNEKLLQVEKEIRQMRAGERNTVYSHLAAHLPVSKETLVKRAKRLVTEQQEKSLRQPLQRLKEAVIAAMPALIEKHQAECAIAEQKRQLQQQQQSNSTGGKEKTGGALSNESEEDASQDKPDALPGEGQAADKQKRVHAPRKKFEWTPQIRSLLCDVVRTKMEHYETMKGRLQTAEEFLRAFLDAEVRTIWPTGWTQTRMLFKESRDVHAKWTNATAKPKKIVIPGTTGSRPSSAVSTPVSNQNTPMSNTRKVSASGVLKTEDPMASPALFNSPDLGRSVPTASEAKAAVAFKEQPSPTLLDYSSNSSASQAKKRPDTSAHTHLGANVGTESGIQTATNNSASIKTTAVNNVSNASVDHTYMQHLKDFSASITNQANNQISVAKNLTSTQNITKPQQPTQQHVNKKTVSNTSAGSNQQSTSPSQNAHNSALSHDPFENLKRDLQNLYESNLNSQVYQATHMAMQYLIGKQQQKRVPQQTTKHFTGASQKSPVSSNHYSSPSSANSTPAKSDMSTHNTSTDSEDIPLANYSKSHSHMKQSGTQLPGNIMRSPGVHAPPRAGTNNARPSSLDQQSRSQVHVPGISKAYQQSNRPTGLASVKNSGLGTGVPKVIQVTTAAEQKSSAVPHSTSAQSYSVTEIDANAFRKLVQTQNVKFVSKGQERVKTSPQMSYQTQSHGSTMSASAGLPKQQTHNQIHRTQQHTGANMVSSMASNMASNSLPLSNNKQSLATHQTGHTKQQLSHVSHTQRVSNSSPKQAPLASSSPRPSSKSPQAGSATAAAWLAEASRAYSLASAVAATSPTAMSYTGGRPLVDIGSKSTAAAMHGTHNFAAAATGVTNMMSPERYDQAAAFFNQMSPMAQQSMTSSMSATQQSPGLFPMASATPDPDMGTSQHLYSANYSLASQDPLQQYRRY